jgi:hypothetical protein
MTTTEEEILEIAKQLQSEFDSIKDLLQYIKAIQIFENYETADNNEEHVKKYPYQIPLNMWNKEFNLKWPDTVRVEFDDGAIFVDQYFDSDYRDYDMPTKYVYIYCDNNA